MRLHIICQVWGATNCTTNPLFFENIQEVYSYKGFVVQKVKTEQWMAATCTTIPFFQKCRERGIFLQEVCRTEGSDP